VASDQAVWRRTEARERPKCSNKFFSIASREQIPYTRAMSERIAARLPKWPFLVSDVALLIVAGFIVYSSAWPLGIWQIGFCLGAVAVGAWLCIIPFLQEFRAAAHVAEANALSTALAQIQNLDKIQQQIENATNQWTVIQEHSARTAQISKDISERFKVEGQELCAFFEKANDKERAHLRLEAEKLRRSERDWLQAAVYILDHIYALHQAASRSGQPRLIAQLNQFQQACREAIRRLGLVAFGPNHGDLFDAAAHQTSNSNDTVPADARIAETVAVGFTFQGRLIRRAVVGLQTDSPDNPPEAESASESPASDSHSNGEAPRSSFNETADPEVAPLRAGQKELSIE
jgi:molecular chaperone GrpE (heat shock protein)